MNTDADTADNDSASVGVGLWEYIKILLALSICAWNINFCFTLFK